jgi:hypothetical protein
VVLHALEDDHAITGRLDQLVEYLEAIRFAQAMLSQLAFDETLGRVLEALLNLANAGR